MSDRDQPRQGRCPRWMRVLLGVSLALNLLVAGLAAGAALRHGRAGGMHAAPHSLAGAMIRELPPQDRRALSALARDDLARDGHGDRRARRRAEAAAVTGALRAVPFDAAALRAVLEGTAEAPAPRDVATEPLPRGQPLPTTVVDVSAPWPPSISSLPLPPSSVSSPSSP